MATETDDTIMDVKLFKIMGLYQFLRPAERGGLGQRTHRACQTVAWLNIVYMVVQLAWLPSVVHDFQRTIFFTATLAFCLMCMLKLYALSHYRTRFWTILDSSQFAFTARGARHPDTLRQSRVAVSRFLRCFVTLVVSLGFMWMTFPLFRMNHVTVTNADGTVGVYRGTVMSMWFPLPERVHNSLPGWTVLYVAESVSFAMCTLGLQFFDCYLITVFFVMSAQFRTLNAGYKTLGCSLRSSTSHCHSDVSHDMACESMQTDYYSDLICHIKDNQKLKDKYDDFVDVLRPYIIIHIINCSFTVITFMYSVCLVFVLDQSTMNFEIFKMICTLIHLIMQLYIYCYGFDLIETAKSSLNFGLYSCNWTEMDLKFQKTMLLAMAMNSAHKKSMKITPNFVINRELFFRVMKASFSVIPVLLQLSS